MKKNDFSFSADLLATGYVYVSRSMLKTACSADEDRKAARLMLCVLVNAYFKTGVMYLGRSSFICEPGEWITSVADLARRLEMDRRVVRSILAR